MLVDLADRLLVKLMQVVPVEHHIAMMAVASNLKTEPCEVGGLGIDLEEPLDDDPGDVLSEGGAGYGRDP
jgi:hypothetical protein